MTSLDQRIIKTDPSAMRRAIDAGNGIVRLTPAWVPRVFSTPGRRLRLHPDDYYPYGRDRGGIDERWLASAIRADNGPASGPYEGMSMVVDPEGSYLPFEDLVGELGADLIGARLWSAFGRWPMMSKFFDNQQALPHHVHHTDQQAELVHKKGKPEAYYFAPQMNNHLGDHPYTYLGIRPGVTKAQVLETLRGFERGGDNRITDLSVAYRIKTGTGWNVPAGLLHAPGSACTYEPQAASDVFSMFESWSNNREVPAELAWKDVAVDRVGDYEALMDLVDWEANTDPQLGGALHMTPFETARSLLAADPRHTEKWVVYLSSAFSAKELTVRPGQAVVVTDQDAYGCIALQGYGEIGAHQVCAISTIRFGEDSEDEFFISESAARAGVRVVNRSATTNLVILKHFGPRNTELAGE